MMKVLFYSIILISSLSAFSESRAQGNVTPNGVPQNPGEPVPITGIEYLLVAGGAYGAYRFAKKKNKNED